MEDPIIFELFQTAKETLESCEYQGISLEEQIARLKIDNPDDEDYFDKVYDIAKRLQEKL